MLTIVSSYARNYLKERIMNFIDKTMIETLQGYVVACESNLKEILTQNPVDQRAVDATQGMIDNLNMQIGELLI